MAGGRRRTGGGGGMSSLSRPRRRVPDADPADADPAPSAEMPGGRTTLVSVAGGLASLLTLTAVQLLDSGAFRDLADPVKVAAIRAVAAVPTVGVAAYVGGQALVAACRVLAGAVAEVADVWRGHGGGRIREIELEARLQGERAKANAELARYRAAWQAERQKREYAETLIPGLAGAARPAKPVESADSAEPEEQP